MPLDGPEARQQVVVAGEVSKGVAGDDHQREALAQIEVPHVSLHERHGHAGFGNRRRGVVLG